MICALLAVLILALAACSARATAAFSGDKLTSGVTYSADLDGDGVPEKILVDGTPASLTISDGETVYHSLDKWSVVEACLGDTDRDGLPEIVALLDADDGRHLGLFAYFGGKYRERLVTQALTPRPLTLQVVTGEEAADAGDQCSPASTEADDLLILTEEPAPGENGLQTTTYRWNGFGFTAIDQTASP